MSGFDPLAVLAAQAVTNAQAAIDQATLSLGADVAVLQAQVNVGDVIAATVLAPRSGTDLLSFLGQTVAAQIPPGINPGETLLLQVTGFTNSAVIVRNLGTLDPENPIPTVNVEIPPPPEGAPQSALLVTQAPNSPAPSPPATSTSDAPTPIATTPIATTPSATPAPANVAPPREVFVAASVQPNPPPPSRIVAQAIEEPIEHDVEARIALTRAGALFAPPPTRADTTLPRAVAPSPTAAPPTARLPVAPPLVRPAALSTEASSPTPAATRPAVPVAPSTPGADVLARLRVPITATTLGAARTIEIAAQSVTSAYERLEGLLAKLAPESGAGALRSTLAFVARFDLRNASALPEQIATYVSDVLDGAEAKIVQIVRAWIALAQEEPTPTPAAQEADVVQAESAAPSATASAPLATPAATTLASAQVAERAAALEYDVKGAILAIIANSGRDLPPQITSALREALTATTALQLNVLSAQQREPNTISIPLPAYFYEGGQPAQLRISRDAPNGKNKMDADNFHVAFVLDTKALGTVAIDVQTAARAVSVDVKTERASAANHVRETLGDLRSRLERMRYRVASIAAGVAPVAQAAAPPPEAPVAPSERRSFWDMRA
jgi:hypothetical protein